MAENDSDTTKDRIIEAAGEEFAARSFDLARVRDICQRAGANLAAVNYYFGGKQRLYIEAVKQAHQWHMDRASLPDWTDDTPAETRLRDFIHTFVRRVSAKKDDSWQSRLMMREMLRHDAACEEVVRESIEPQFELLLSILRELAPRRTSDEKLHLIAFSVVGQCLHYHFADPVVRKLVSEEEYAGYDTQKLADHITQFSLKALNAMNQEKTSFNREPAASAGKSARSTRSPLARG
jgi:AcrR family transcriptional regulator